MNTSIHAESRRGSRRLLAMLALAGSLVVLAGCAQQSSSSSVYTYGQTQREQIVRLGTVEAVRNVVIQNDRSTGAGTLAGGALGGVAGSTIGGGSGRVLATIGGGLLGALAGNAVENQMGKSSGLEITVRRMSRFGWVSVCGSSAVAGRLASPRCKQGVQAR